MLQLPPVLTRTDVSSRCAHAVCYLGSFEATLTRFKLTSLRRSVDDKNPAYHFDNHSTRTTLKRKGPACPEMFFLA